MTPTPSPERVELVEAAMRSYAEAAMQHGWQSALGAANSGRLAMTWDTAWFERNPPITAMPEELIDRLTNPAKPSEVERLRKLVRQYVDPFDVALADHALVLAIGTDDDEAYRLAMTKGGGK